MFDEVKNKVIGGAAVLLIGGTGFAVSQTDVINNFAKETGMSQEQATDYVNNLKEEDLASFTEIGQEHIDSGKQTLKDAKDTDCVNYEYEWQSSTLSCEEGKAQLTRMGNDETAMGKCYKELDTDLGSTAKNKIEECVDYIDAYTADLGLAIAKPYFGEDYVKEQKQSNAYNKSILVSAE